MSWASESAAHAAHYNGLDSIDAAIGKLNVPPFPIY
jgi:hypothetical protein